MAKLIYGERIGASAKLRPGCTAAIFDAGRQKILLERRADNGRWGLPGGGMDPGESATESCVRELFEETGLHTRIRRLVGIYTDPHMILEYPDGNRWQVVAFHFEAEIVGGELTLSAETKEIAYFSQRELETLDMMEHHRPRIVDSFAEQEGAFIR